MSVDEGLRPRGANDEGAAGAQTCANDAHRDTGHSAAAAPDSGAGGSTRLTYLLLLRNKPYLFTVLGYAAYTFALGGLAYWMPAFLERIRGMSPEKSTLQFGEIVVITGFVGTFAGGWLGDYCAKYSKQAYLLVSAAATLLAAPFRLARPHHGLIDAVPGEHGDRAVAHVPLDRTPSTPPSSIWCCRHNAPRPWPWRSSSFICWATPSRPT